MDSLGRMRELDPRGVMRTVSQMPDALRDSNRLGRDVEVKRSTYGEVAIVGMGGSAIGGDMISSLVEEAGGSIPCRVARSYSVPKSIDPDSLVVAVSYSGNTEETLSMARDALSRGATVATVSSGGGLRELAEEHSLPHCDVPSGLVPRAALGHLFGAASGVLESAGVLDLSGQMGEALAVLEDVSAHCGPETPTADNPAKKLAHELSGTVPVTIGYGLTAPVARRWANQLNENAKMVAFSTELPEMDHNEIVGWAGDGRAQGFSAVFLDHDSGDARMTRRVEATKQMMRDRLRVYSSAAVGTSPLSRLLSLVMVGDYVSVYSAFLRGEDPSTTEPIERLKAILSEKGT